MRVSAATTRSTRDDFRAGAVASADHPWFLFLTMSNVDPKPLEQLATRLPNTVRRNEVLAPYTTFKIGGPADLFLEATSADSLANAVLAARQTGVPYFVLGL